MLQPINPLSSIFLMESVSLLKSLGSREENNDSKKSESEKLREKVGELEKKIDRKPPRIGEGISPSDGNDNNNPDDYNPFRKGDENPFGGGIKWVPQTTTTWTTRTSEEENHGVMYSSALQATCQRQ